MYVSNSMLNRTSKRLFSLLLVVTFWMAAAAAGQAAEGASHYADYNGNRVFYFNYGQGDEAVVFVHGWTCDHTFWRLQAPGVAEKWRVILVDLPGHGKSDKPKIDYTLAYFAESLGAVLEDAGVKKAVLVGHSMGVPVSRLYALKHPNHIKGFISVDGAFINVPEDREGREKWKRDFEALAESFKGPQGEETAIKFIASMFGPQTPPEVRDEILSKTTATPRRVAVSAMEGMGDPRVWSDEEPLQVPTLAIFAKSPHMWPGFDDFIRRRFPNLDYRVWEGVGHFYMFERPEALTKAINEFLDKLDSR